VLYTAHGGIISVTYTDIFQFLILIIVIPITTIIALKQAGAIKHVFTYVPVSQFQLWQHPKFTYYATLFISMSVFQFSVIDPALRQRILMGKTKQQLRNQFIIIGTVKIALVLTLLLLWLTSIVLFPNDIPVSIILHIANNTLPIGLKGSTFAGLFAITMATFESFYMQQA